MRRGSRSPGDHRIRAGTVVMLLSLSAVVGILLAVPVATATATQVNMQGLSKAHTCGSNCPGLTHGALFGWNEGDWVPFQLTITNIAPVTLTVVLDLDYHILQSGSDKYGVDSFASCSENCGSGDLPRSGTVMNVLIDGSDTPVVGVTVAKFGSADVLQVNLGPINFPDAKSHTIQWANHLALSGGANLANTELFLSDEPTSHENGASTWPGARIHEFVSLSGDVSGTRDVPIMRPGVAAPPEFPEPPVVSKDANPSFTRTYSWSIAKYCNSPTDTLSSCLVKQIGGTVPFNYNVVVTETGFVDDDWVVSGAIVVDNPNNVDITISSLSDAVDNGGTCVVSGTFPDIIPALTTSTYDYTCTYSLAPNPSSGTNTATAAFAAITVGENTLAAGTAFGSATFDFGSVTPTTVDQAVTVTDNFNSGGATTLGIVTATLDGSSVSTSGLGAGVSASTSGTTAALTYSHTINVPTFGCLAYPNEATVVETGQTADATATVCGPAHTGALTMGFWQNKNGQGIIKGGSSTSGVCNSGTWLGQFAPFKDLSATATCAQVATYVYNIIKAANAGGATMNAMLKAQMLATALDVYFSDPGLGGNKIGAPGPIGAQSIDLTMICKNIPSCSVFEDTSSAFGASSCLTVSQLLTFAAGQSNSGGITWYGNVKSVQGLAKDTFDAINNQVAFAC